MFINYIDELYKAAEAAYPKEFVALITESGVMVVENVHEDPHNHFEVSLEDTLAAHKEGLLAVVHSHCDTDLAPSKHDMLGQESMDIPWGIIQVSQGVATGDIWWDGKASPEPYEGRRFIHGISDCYSLVRDFYLNNGVTLPIVPREWEWWEHEELFDNLFEEFGFIEVPLHAARYGDMLVINVRGKFQHHCGVLLDGEEFIHHPGANEPYNEGRLSVRDSIHRYAPYITKVLRHKEFKRD